MKVTIENETCLLDDERGTTFGMTLSQLLNLLKKLNICFDENGTLVYKTVVFFVK